MKARKERVADIYEELVAVCGREPNVHQLALYWGIDDAKVKKRLEGVPGFKDGRRLKFRAKAVAERMADLEAMPWY